MNNVRTSGPLRGRSPSRGADDALSASSLGDRAEAATAADNSRAREAAIGAAPAEAAAPLVHRRPADETANLLWQAIERTSKAFTGLLGALSQTPGHDVQAGEAHYQFMALWGAVKDIANADENSDAIFLRLVSQHVLETPTHGLVALHDGIEELKRTDHFGLLHAFHRPLSVIARAVAEQHAARERGEVARGSASA